VRCREFITLLAGAAGTWPMAARGQQAMPLIGFLGLSSPDAFDPRLAAFKNGPGRSRFSENRNVEIIYAFFCRNRDPTSAFGLRVGMEIVHESSSPQICAARRGRCHYSCPFTNSIGRRRLRASG
jgi:putative tryptophan/tyrosine transport system substrate-binding protein